VRGGTKALKYRVVRLAAPFLRGNRVECPVCAGRFRTFLPFHGRPNTLCPRCGSLERDRLVWLYLRTRTNLLSGARLRVLHVAPEHCIQEQLRSRLELDYLSADLFSPLAMVKMDVHDIGEPDASFDVIICNHVLDDVADDRLALRELHRVLRPDGWAILLSPVDESLERTRAEGEHDAGSVRTYGRDYVSLLEEPGFRVRVDRFSDELGAEAVTRHALDEQEPIYYCTREPA
jgi:SAM-dependent methyltransferase